MDPLICQIAIPTADQVDPSWVMQAWDELHLAQATHLLGSADFHMPMAHRLHGLRRQEDSERVLLALVAGVDVAALPVGGHGLPLLSLEADRAGKVGRLLGTAEVGGSTRENLAVAEVWVLVQAQARRRGLGTALHAAAEAIADAMGRTTLQSWAEHELPRDAQAPRLVPATGTGAIAADAAAGFATAMGYRLEQCERHSVCELPVPGEVLDELWRQSVDHAGDYRLRSWHDAIPDDLVDQVADLVRHFSLEVPSGELHNEEADVDADRLRRSDERRAAIGRHSVRTVAVHEPTGEVVALTDIVTDGEHPEVCFQEVTIVDRAHRGHRLGTLVKVANHRALSEHHPERRRLHTWNAAENQHMLAINDALGFRERLVEGAWQQRG